LDSYAYNSLSEEVIGAAIEVHRKIGPGLLESAYRECLTRELQLRDIPFEREVAVPVIYKDIHLECGYRIDFLIDRRLVLEIKSVESLAPVHEAQLLTYLSLGGWPLGLLMNFNVKVLKDGIRRRVLNLPG
jgi:GxxExxY protein